jgi:cyclopropane-fatty-acyl-phospholipid synthase
MTIHDFAFLRRFAAKGDIGIGESYLRREWESPDLATFIELFAANRALIARMLDARPWTKWLQRLLHGLNRNSHRGARRNIEAHYDLGNNFYRAWLDPTMTYSSAVFAQGETDLAAAQRRKYRLIAEALSLRPDSHVLEIGCGWGGFAEFLANEYRCRVTGLTISQEQYDFACRRVRDAGLDSRVEIKFRDYRDERGVYDGIASIEMLEAVGEKYWPTYFEQLRNCLRIGAKAALQVITIREEDFPTYKNEIDFIRRYIFPGGMLPTASVLRRLSSQVGLALTSERCFGLDYAKTLSTWRQRFIEAWPNLISLGFDERFRRMWEYYLCYCEGGFRAGKIDVRQVVLQRG